MASITPASNCPEVVWDESLPLIEIGRSEDELQTKAKLKIRQDTLERVLQSCGNQPLSILTVSGHPESGKSFLLNYIMRALEALEKSEADWMDWNNKTKPLNGFDFPCGEELVAETEGIWIWSRPFRVKMEDGSIINVLLMDTPGIHDHRIRSEKASQDKSVILRLSLVMSSVTIMNCLTDIPEAIIAELNTFLKYGVLIQQNSGNENPPFQNLMFLIRDWNNPTQYAFGATGGRIYLENKLKISNGWSNEAKYFYETIRKCFQKSDCFLMPHIGSKVNDPQFSGTVSELDINFSRKLEQFISDLVNPENIPIKSILGDPVWASEFKLYMEAFVDAFNLDEHPSPSKLLEATATAHNSIHVKLALGKYLESMRRKQWGKQYLADDDFLRAHRESKKVAEGYFEKKECGEWGKKHKSELNGRIEECYLKAKKKNEEKRQMVLVDACSHAMTSYRQQLKQTREKLLNEFRVTLINESEESFQTLTQSFHFQLDQVLKDVLRKNEDNHQTARGEIHSILGIHRENMDESKNLKDDSAEKTKRQKEEVKRKLDEEMKKRDGDLEILNDCLPTAICQVKKMVRAQTFYWIQTNANPENIVSFQNIYEYCLSHILEHNYRNVVAPYHWETFHKSVYAGCVDDCSSFLSVIFNPVCQFNMELKRQLQLDGYFLHQRFEKVAPELATKFMAAQVLTDPKLCELMSSAMVKLFNIHKTSNTFVMESEKAIRETISLRVKNFYNEEIKRYLSENGAFTKNEFHEVHRELVSELIECSRRIATLSTRKVLRHDVIDWLVNLERDLNDAFVGHKESNELKLVVLQKQINKFVSARYEEYVVKMESILQKNPDGYDPRKLERDHKAFSMEQQNLLGIDLRKKISKSEPTDGHCEALLHQINQYWPTVVMANENNFEKKQKLREEEKAQKFYS